MSAIPANAMIRTSNTTPMMSTSFMLSTRAEVVVVLVCDVRNYTRMSEVLPSREMSELMSRWFREASAIIDANMGTVDKFIGDAVLAYWVAETKADPAREAFAALKAAGALVASSRDFSSRLSSQFPGHVFDIGVGLNLGPAMLCNVGNSEHQSFTAVGDTVNVAFRLEPFSKTK